MLRKLGFEIIKVGDFVIVCLRGIQEGVSAFASPSLREDAIAGGLTQNSSRPSRCERFSMQDIWLFPISNTRSLL